MNHPVQIVFDMLTSIVEPAMGEAKNITSPCSCCGRDPLKFNSVGYVGLNSYKQPYVHCPACQSFTVGDVSITGIERGDSVPQKFGMMSGVGAAIEINTGRAVLFAPAGVIKKLPAYFTERVCVELVKESQHLNWIVNNNLSLPIIYIRNFGRKTYDLIQNLKVTTSLQSFWICTDGGSEEIPVGVLLSINEDLSSADNKQFKLFNETVAKQARGQLSPTDAAKIWAENPNLAVIAQKMPHDPHLKLSILSSLRAMRA